MWQECVFGCQPLLLTERTGITCGKFSCALHKVPKVPQSRTGPIEASGKPPTAAASRRGRRSVLRVPTRTQDTLAAAAVPWLHCVCCAAIPLDSLTRLVPKKPAAFLGAGASSSSLGSSFLAATYGCMCTACGRSEVDARGAHSRAAAGCSDIRYSHSRGAAVLQCPARLGFAIRGCAPLLCSAARTCQAAAAAVLLLTQLPACDARASPSRCRRTKSRCPSWARGPPPPPPPWAPPSWQPPVTA